MLSSRLAIAGVNAVIADDPPVMPFHILIVIARHFTAVYLRDIGSCWCMRLESQVYF